MATKRPTRIGLVSKDNYLTFQPMLPPLRGFFEQLIEGRSR